MNERQRTEKVGFEGRSRLRRLLVTGKERREERDTERGGEKGVRVWRRWRIWELTRRKVERESDGRVQIVARRCVSRSLWKKK